jgi:HAD superfamily hydrolase (TIGR01509 family)
VSLSIRTVFWDIGGVILTNGWGHEQRNPVLARLGVDMDAFEEMHERANYYWERGLISAEDYLMQTVMRPNPKLQLTFDYVWPQVCAASKVLHPECLDMVAEMKQQGRWRLATLNNESRELNEHRLNAFKLRGLFEYFICSGYVHEMKPALGIYRTAIDISGFAAETALFIDDKQENCDAAASLGMKTIHFQSPAQLRENLLKFGIAL